MVRLLGVLLVLVLAAPACGDDTSANEPDPLIAVAAGWQCDRQRFAFDSLADVDELLQATLDAHGVSAESFASFEAELDTDDELRAAVLDEYRRSCRYG